MDQALEAELLHHPMAHLCRLRKPGCILVLSQLLPLTTASLVYMAP